MEVRETIGQSRQDDMEMDIGVMCPRRGGHIYEGVCNSVGSHVPL